MSPHHFLKFMVCKVDGIKSEPRMNGAHVMVNDYLGENDHPARHHVVPLPGTEGTFFQQRYPGGFNCKPENLVKVCCGCHSTSPRLFKCTRCVTGHYCGIDCQEKDWPAHKDVCSSSQRDQVVFYSKQLIDAVFAGDAQEVREVLKMSPNLNHVTPSSQKTALHCAAEINEIEIAAILIDNMADINRPSGYINGTRMTPLGLALMHGHTEMVKLLRERGGREEE